jgi:hypothetical protein
MLNIPKQETSDGLPYVFIGGETFSLREDFMKPFSQKNLTRDAFTATICVGLVE